MNIWKAPFYALFDLNFYRSAAQAKLSKGFLYLLYLAGIAAVFFLIFFYTVLNPQLNGTIDWVKQNMPNDLVFKDGMLYRSSEAPFTMIHPDYGALVTFDMAKPSVTLEELQGVPVIVTSNRMYYVQRGEIQSYNLSDFTRGRPQTEDIFINGELIDQVIKEVKPIFTTILFCVMAPAFYIWNLLAALFYSLIGLFINHFRFEKMSYLSIFNISIFSMTASILIQFLRMLLPFLGGIPFGPLGSLIVTIPYLVYAIKYSEKTAEI